MSDRQIIELGEDIQAPFGECPHCGIGWLEEATQGDGMLYCPHCSWDNVYQRCSGSHMCEIDNIDHLMKHTKF